MAEVVEQVATSARATDSRLDISTGGGCLQQTSSFQPITRSKVRVPCACNASQADIAPSHANMIVLLLSTRAGGAGLVLDPDSTEPDPCRPCLGPSFTAVVGLTTFATRTALRALRLGPQERLQTKCLKVSSADDTDIKNNTRRLTPSAG